MPFKCFIFVCVLAISLVSYSLNTYAEVIAGEAVAFEISRDGLQDKMEKLAAKPGVDPDSKAREMNWYQLSDENIGDQQWFAYLYSSYQGILKTAAEKLKTKTQTTISKDNAVLFNPEQHYSPEQLELLIVNSKAKLRAVNGQLSKLETELHKFSLRPQQIREQTLVAKQSLKQAKLEINIARQPTENKYEYQARQIYLYTLINALAEELKKLELEATVNPLQIQLNKHSQEPLVVQQQYLQDIVDQQEGLFKKLQLAKAESLEEALLKTEQESSSKNAVIQQIIQDNIHWSRDLQKIVRAINQYDHEIDKIDAYKRSIEHDYKNVEKKIKLAGLNPLLGRVLREQRNILESNKQKYQRQVDISDETGLISLALYKIELRQKQLLNIQTELELQLQQVQKSPGAKNLSVNEIQQISQEIDELLIDQKEILGELSNTYLKHLRVVGDYKFASEQLLTLIDQYASFLDQRLLWVPSSLPIGFDYPVNVYHSIRWFGSPQRWLHLGKNLLKTVESKIYISSFFVILWFFLLYLNLYLSKEVGVIREKVGKPYTDKVYYTFQVLLFDFVSVLPVPLLLFFISWALSLLSFYNDFSRAIGVGLHHAAIVMIILQLFTRFLEDQGVAELHFRWQKKAICLIRKQLAWMKFVIVPSIFIIYMTSANNVAEYSDSLGRLGLIALISVLFVFAVRLFQPGQGILDEYLIKNTKLWWANLRYLWMIVFISIPLIIFVSAVMGYYISALELQQKTVFTIRMIIIAIILHNIIIRWLALAKRELALKNARNVSKAAELNTQASESPNTETLHIADEELLDISKINQQSEKIVNVLISTLLLISFWLIWKNILPAFSFIENIVLWQHIVVINNEETIQAVTLSNLFIAGFYIFLISIATINFPGVMEILVFRKLEVEAGSRYAINQLTKYAMITLGFIIVAHELGGSWDKVQWLVAALTVGLGFGLQEIFANMVSGIILLFERPIRVGDTVTVDNITGTVTRIQMRATTIIDWDHKELIVPNKTFITSQLVNWTLTDPMTRIVVPIGISYGSDIDLAYKTIKETVCATPLVLKDPEPSIYFIGFGDSSLDFTIRIYVQELSHRLQVIHDIHIRLTQALRKAGIEIPFPQRDLHIHSVHADASENTIQA